MEKTKEVAVLFGTGSIGQAIIRRIGVKKHIVLALTMMLLDRWRHHCQLLVW